MLLCSYRICCRAGTAHSVPQLQQMQSGKAHAVRQLQATAYAFGLPQHTLSGSNSPCCLAATRQAVRQPEECCGAAAAHAVGQLRKCRCSTSCRASAEQLHGVLLSSCRAISSGSNRAHGRAATAHAVDWLEHMLFGSYSTCLTACPRAGC